MKEAMNNYDAAGVERAVRDLLTAFGEDPDREGLKETPARMARAWAEMTSGLHEDPSVHLEKHFHVDHEEMVLVRDIEFHSCANTTCPSTAGTSPIPKNAPLPDCRNSRVGEGCRRPQVQSGDLADRNALIIESTGACVLSRPTHVMTMRVSASGCLKRSSRCAASETP